MDATKVLAKVGAAVITDADVTETILALGQRGAGYNTPEGRKIVLDELINQKLLLLDAQRNLYANRCNIAYIRRQIIRFRLPLYTAEERQQHRLVLATRQEVARRPLLLQNRTVAFSNAGRNVRQ